MERFGKFCLGILLSLSTALCLSLMWKWLSLIPPFALGTLVCRQVASQPILVQTADLLVSGVRSATEMLGVGDMG